MPTLLLALALASTPVDGGAPSPPPSVLEEVVGHVERDFYSATVVQGPAWREAVGRARAAWPGAGDVPARTAVLRELLAALKASHTAYYPREDPGYWALASIFEQVLPRVCKGPGAPTLPIEVEGVGALWREQEGTWFVQGVFAGGPAAEAGLLAGDAVVEVDGRPFDSPVRAFQGRAGAPVALGVRRTKDGAPLRLTVTPRREQPRLAFLEATEASARVIERHGRKVGYVRVWTWTDTDVQLAVQDAVARFNKERVDGVVLDLRDGYGGASPSYLSLFDRRVPVLTSTGRDGGSDAFDTQVRTPAVLLVNGGSRSGKEVIAYAAQKHRLARLVGERTAGAVLAGRPYCLQDGGLLYLAVRDTRVDGVRLEGRGVTPDVVVDFDPRFAGGKDPQLERAVELLTSPKR